MGSIGANQKLISVGAVVGLAFIGFYLYRKYIGEKDDKNI
jgi:hypothetical protein